jgi:hypothetical protein
VGKFYRKKTTFSTDHVYLDVVPLRRRHQNSVSTKNQAYGTILANQESGQPGIGHKISTNNGDSGLKDAQGHLLASI